MRLAKEFMRGNQRLFINRSKVIMTGWRIQNKIFLKKIKTLTIKTLIKTYLRHIATAKTKTKQFLTIISLC